MKETPQHNHYTIHIKGHLSLGQFDDMTVTLIEEGVTKIEGWVADQSALYGVLRKIRDMSAELIAVNRTYPDRSDETTSPK